MGRNDASVIVFRQVREGHEVAVQEGKAVVVVAHVEGLAQARNHAVHETEHALVVAEADPVENGLLERQAQFLVRFLFQGHVPQGAVRAADGERDIRVRRGEADVQYIAHRQAVDGAEMLPRQNAGFGRQAVPLDAADDAFLSEFLRFHLGAPSCPYLFPVRSHISLYNILR